MAVFNIPDHTGTNIQNHSGSPAPKGWVLHFASDYVSAYAVLSLSA